MLGIMSGMDTQPHPLKQYVDEVLQPLRDHLATRDPVYEVPWRHYPKNDVLSVYYRVTKRAIAYKRVADTIDLAAVDVAREFQRRGVFKLLIAELQSIAKEYGRVIYVENVHNKMIQNYLDLHPNFSLMGQCNGFSGNCYLCFK